MRALALVAAPGCAPTLLCSVAPRFVHLAVLLTMAALVSSFIFYASCSKTLLPWTIYTYVHA